jgi:hypothetical protein
MAAVSAEGALQQKRPLRVLGLHGWRTSGRILKIQTLYMAKQMGEHVEMVCIDACHPSSGAPYGVVTEYFGADQSNTFEWWDFQKNEETGEWNYAGAEESLEYLDKKVKELGPFDLVYGFSQGTALITLYIAMLQERKQEVPFRGVVLTGGVYPRTVPFNPAFDFDSSKVDILSLHVMGEKDRVIDRSKVLLSYYNESKRSTLTHPAGHQPPGGGQKGCVAEIINWLKRYDFI